MKFSQITTALALCAVSLASVAADRFDKTGSRLDPRMYALYDFFADATKNSAQVIGKTLIFTGYAVRFGTEKAKDGGMLFTAEINYKNYYYKYSSETLICVMPQSEVASLKEKQVVTVRAEIRSVEHPMVMDPQLFNPDIPHLTGPKPATIPVAVCSLAPMPKVEAPATPDAKLNRVSEPGVNAALVTSQLCEPGDKVAFACNTGKKSAAVCVSPKGPQYRFGADRTKLDLTVDAKSATSGSVPLIGGGATFMRFSNGGTNYIVYTAESTSMDKAGIVVEQGEKRLASLTCKNAAIMDVGLAKLPTDTKGFEIP